MSLLRTIYVGIGGAGGYIIKYYNTFFSDKRSLYLDRNVDIEHCRNELNGLKKNIYDQQNLPSYFHKENRYVLLLGLGGKTGSKIITEILGYLHSNGIEHKCYCFYPFSFEPNSRLRTAKESLDNLMLYQNVNILYMDEIKKRYANLNLASVFAIPNEFLVKNCLENDSV